MVDVGRYSRWSRASARLGKNAARASVVLTHQFHSKFKVTL